MIIVWNCACQVCGCKTADVDDLPAIPEFSICQQCWNAHGQEAYFLHTNEKYEPAIQICPRCRQADPTVLLDSEGEPYLCDSCWND